MKRIATSLFTAGLLLATGVVAFAAPAVQPYRNGAIVAQGGIGFGFPGEAGTTTIPPIIASVEYQLKVSPQLPLSVGAVAAYASSKYSLTDTVGDTFTWAYSDVILGARAAYHFLDLVKVKNLDPYAGIMLGYDIVSATMTASGPYASLVTPSYTAAASGFIFGAYAGARYYFTPMIGIYGEIGYNLGYFNLGASFKI